METAAGVASALLATLLWSWSSVLFSPRVGRHGAIAIGLAKSGIAAVLAFATLALAGQSLPSGRHAALLALSGVVGMGLGDMAYLRGLRDAGVRQTTLLHSTAPLYLLAYSALAGSGIRGTTIAGVLCMTAGAMDVTRRRLRGPGTLHPRPVRGMVMGVLAAVCQAGGILLAKDATHAAGPVGASAIRLASAALFTALFLAAARITGASRPVLGWQALKDAALPSFFGTYLGVMAMMAAIRFTEPPVAAALLSLTPLFAIPMSYRLLGEPIRPEVIPGSLLCVLGAILI